MTTHDAERIISEYLKPIFGFALKRCRSSYDAEDLSQEIILKSYLTLIARDDIEDVSKYIWTVAHNALSMYYRDRAKSGVGVSLEEISDVIADPEDLFDDEDKEGSLRRLQSEIAYLSKTQRRIIIAYYFENKKQSEIASQLGIPLGTVKWHLFEAKQELKRGIDKMRYSSELKFNPIKFDTVGFCGSSGTKSTEDFFPSAVSQNICYDARSEAKSVEAIADDLGISPVYVESEVERLEKYGLLKRQKDKYIVNFIIDEPTEDLLILQDKTYKRAAAIFANELYDELISSGIVDDPDIVCNQTDGAIDLKSSFRADRNFILWTLIPFISAWSGEDQMDERIKFEKVATIRPDGGFNIIHATVVPEDIKLPSDYVYMKNWCGPMWSEYGGKVLWQTNSEWSDRGADNGTVYFEKAKRILALLKNEEECGVLSKEDYAFLAECGFVKTGGDYDGDFKVSWQTVSLANKEIKDRLIAVGDRIKERHKAEFDELKAEYIKASLDSVPEHLREVREFELQYVFNSDGWFLLHCIKTLLGNGKLTVPTEGQRKALTTLIFPR